MGLKKHHDQIVTAANLMKSSSNSDDAFTAANAIGTELSELPGVFARQKEIKTEAGDRLSRIQTHLKEALGEIASLRGLFDEGTQGGRTITDQTGKGAEKLGAVGQKMDAAAAKVAEVSGMNTAIILFDAPIQEQVVLESSLPALGAIGIRHEKDFAQAWRDVDKLGGIVGGVDDDFFTGLRVLIANIGVGQGPYDEMAEQGEPQRTIRIAADLATGIVATANAIRQEYNLQ